MKPALAAGAAALGAVAMLTLAFNAPLGPDPAAAPTPTAAKALKLSDLAAPSAARAECKESKHTCVQKEDTNGCANSTGYHYRTRTRAIHKDCSQEETFGDWSCTRPYGDDCYG